MSFVHEDAIKMIIHFFPQRVGLSKNAALVSKKSSAGFIPWRTAARVGKNRYSHGEVFSFFSFMCHREAYHFQYTQSI